MTHDETLHQLGQAMAAHGAWKSRLRAAALRDAETLDPEVIARPDACVFGRWLDMLERSGNADAAEIRAVRSAHVAFHRVAGQVAHKIREGRTESALAALDEGAYAQASDALKERIVAWRSRLVMPWG